MKGKTILAEAPLDSKTNLYNLNFKASTNVCTASECIVTWHKRLGHMNFDSVKKLSGLTDGIKLSLKVDYEKCVTCIKRKQPQLPHNQTRVRANRPLQLIHSDVIGPINPLSYDNKRYVVTFMDDYTHFSAAYLMEAKSETFQFFKQFEAMSTAHFNTKVS